MLRRLLPHPFLTLLLTLTWLMLVNRLSLESLIFGLILGLIIPAMTAPYWPDRARIRNIPAIVSYVLIVLYDIVVSNIVVARIVLFTPNRDLRPAWVTVPLDLRSPEAITVLAGTITLTPGTVTADLAEDGRSLLIHCLHAPDPASVITDIKSRYEARLKEIFE
ncbi:Na+/H+ antiporter subunit E [Paracoccus sp. p4-l81]|uniref:Na+/H+ antiporter subunit E n=1 Tax=unclassified Paracoccus (in: a-proteobacteria) TaxID=2688777 RepID=UPI0035B82A0E